MSKNMMALNRSQNQSRVINGIQSQSELVNVSSMADVNSRNFADNKDIAKLKMLKRGAVMKLMAQQGSTN